MRRPEKLEGEAVRKKEVAYEVSGNKGWDRVGGQVRGGLGPMWTLAFMPREMGRHWKAWSRGGT